MPALQRRKPSTDLRHEKVSINTAHPMVRSHSRSSSEDGTEAVTSKMMSIPEHQVTQLPTRYESDEESVSPCPDDFEDASSTFSDEDDSGSVSPVSEEIPAIVEAKQVQLSYEKPVLVNITRLAPIERRTTPAHVRPTLRPAAHFYTKTSIGRTVVVNSASEVEGSLQPSIINLHRPALRFRPPPPVPPRHEARAGGQSIPLSSLVPESSPLELPLRSASVPPERMSHAPRQSVSTVGTIYETDDGRSSFSDDHNDSSAPSSVADDLDLISRHSALKPTKMVARQASHALRRRQDAELEQAINDYMQWRSEGSPGEPPETVYKLSNEDRQMVRDQEEEDWRRELEKGLETPKPTTYAAYDPFGVSPPSLGRPRSMICENSMPLPQQQLQQQQQQPQVVRRKGLRNMIRRGV